MLGAVSFPLFCCLQEFRRGSDRGVYMVRLALVVIILDVVVFPLSCQKLESHVKSFPSVGASWMSSGSVENTIKRESG
jgi:hypothetical protein